MTHTCLFLYLQSKGVHDVFVYSKVRQRNEIRIVLWAHHSLKDVRYGTEREREREVERRYVFISSGTSRNEASVASSPEPVSLVKRLQYITVRERGGGRRYFLSSWSFSPFADVRWVRMDRLYPRVG